MGHRPGTGKPEQLRLAALRFDRDDGVLSQAARVDPPAVGARQQRVRTRDEDVVFLDLHRHPVDAADALRRVHRGHRPPHEEPRLRGVEREEARPLELDGGDEFVVAVELEHLIGRDERHIPERSVRLDRDVVRLRVRPVPHGLQVDDLDDLMRLEVDDGHGGRLLVRHVEERAFGGGGGHVRRRDGPHRHQSGQPQGEEAGPRGGGHSGQERCDLHYGTSSGFWYFTMNRPSLPLVTMIVPLAKYG
ncbi:MAG: hypothetical protein F4143_11040 [Gemmatimonadales bacterium]|nr:hypothetical protein [Gemmatimonadales bacterium]